MQFLEQLTATVRRQHSEVQSPAFPPARTSSDASFAPIRMPAVQLSPETPSLTQEDLLLLTKKLSRKLANTQRRYGVMSQQCDDYSTIVSQLAAVVLEVTGQPLTRFLRKEDASGAASMPGTVGAHEAALDTPAEIERVRAILSKLAVLKEGPLDGVALTHNMCAARVIVGSQIDNATAGEKDTEALRKSYETQIRKLSKEFSVVEDRHIAKQHELSEESGRLAATIARMQQELAVATSATCSRCAAARRFSDRAQQVLQSQSNANLELAHNVRRSMMKMQAEVLEFVFKTRNDLNAFQAWMSTVQRGYLLLRESSKNANPSSHAKSALNTEGVSVSPRISVLMEEIDRLHKDSASRSARSISLLAEKEAQLAALQARLLQQGTSVSSHADSSLVDELKEITSQLTLSRSQEALLKDVIRDLQQQIQVCTSLISPMNVTYLRNVILQLLVLTNSLPLPLSTKAQRESLARVIATILNFDADECRKAGCAFIGIPQMIAATGSTQQLASSDAQQTRLSPPSSRDNAPGMYEVNLASPLQVGRPRRIVDVDGLEPSVGHII